MKTFERGQSLFELVVAIAISALIIVAVISLVSGSIRNATFSKNNAQASSYAQGAIEWLRTERDTDISTFMTKVSIDAPAPTTYCFTNLNWNSQSVCSSSAVISGTLFTRSGVFTVTEDATGKTFVNAEIKVEWTDGQGSHEVVDSTTFTDWRQR